MGSGRLRSEMDLKQDQLQHIIYMYKDGCSDVEVKAFIYSERGSFSNDLWDRWLKEEEVFSETIKLGRLLSNAWWEKNGRISLRDKEFNYTGWYMNMKNRFGWKDKQDITSDDEPIKIAFASFTDDSNGS